MTEFPSCDRITVGAIGEPGKRVFILQGRSGAEVAGVILEKGHVGDLGRGGYQLLTEAGYPELAQEVALRIQEGDAIVDEDVLEDPAGMWRAAELEISFDGLAGSISLLCRGYEQEEHPEEILFTITPEQLGDLIVQAFVIVAQGRPICPVCNLPMDPEGHDCPGTNGHRVRVRQGG